MQELYSFVFFSMQADWVAMNYVPLAEGVLRLTVQLYRTTASQTSVVQKEVAYDIVKVSLQRFSFVF